MTLEEIVELYRRDPRCSPSCGDELEWYAALPNLQVAIGEAALCRDSRGKRHSHQRRLKAAVLAMGRMVLLEAEQMMAQAHTFEALHGLVTARLRPIKGIGSLTIYDVTARIGAFLKLAPTAVYLHAGAAEGAKALGIRSVGGRPVPLDRFPAPLQRVGAYHLENLLCIFKRDLKAARRLGERR